MSFRGELREFELPDILQLIASQQKAGWLKVISRGRCQFVFFRDGRITSTKNPADEIDPLETYIFRRGYLSDDQADRVAAVRRRSGLDIQDVLQKEGFFTAEEIQEIFESMVEQDIFELMSIRSGQYEFETEERPAPLPEGTLCAEIGPILMEGARKADEVNEMRRSLGPEDGVLVLTPTGREADSLSPDEAAVVALINGVRPIDAVIEECGLDRYTATRTLFGCARNGWVALVKGRWKRPVDPLAESVFDPHKTLRWAVTVVALLGMTLLYSTLLQDFHAGDPFVGEWLNRGNRLRAAQREQGVRTAVEVYRVKKGSYPETLGVLVTEDLLPSDYLRDRDEDRWVYTVAGEGKTYALSPAPRSSSRALH